MKKFYKLNGEKVKIIRDLEIKDNHGTWVQIEFVEGKNKKNKKPITKESLKY